MGVYLQLHSHGLYHSPPTISSLIHPVQGMHFLAIMPLSLFFAYSSIFTTATMATTNLTYPYDRLLSN